MHRRPARFALSLAGLCLVVIGVSGAAAGSSTPVPVKVSPRNEFAPAAGGGFFTWARSRRGHPRVYDVWAQQEGQAAFRVNPTGTSAYGGGIDGTTLVYQQVRRFDSNLQFFDLVTRQRTNMPPGVNTSRWEWKPTISGDWLLFGRSNGNAEQMLLRSLATGEQRLLDSERGKRSYLGPGQVNGNYAVWAKCQRRCDVFRYDIAAGTKAPLPRSSRFLYAPSVVPSGATYYARSKNLCRGEELVKTTLDGATIVLAQLGSGADVTGTYALVLPERPPNGVPANRIYFESVKCRTERSDIYSIDDIEPAPPPRPQGP
jgi:hypothetical protein